METDVIKELWIGLIGRPVEIGVYEKDSDNWIATDAGVLTSYLLTPDESAVVIARSNHEASATKWDPKTQYILITIIK